MAYKTIWRLPVVMSRTGLAKSTIYSKISRGEFPEPIDLGVRARGWLADEVESWLTERIKKSRGEDA